MKLYDCVYWFVLKVIPYLHIGFNVYEEGPQKIGLETQFLDEVESSLASKYRRDLPNQYCPNSISGRDYTCVVFSEFYLIPISKIDIVDLKEQ